LATLFQVLARAQEQHQAPLVFVFTGLPPRVLPLPSPPPTRRSRDLRRLAGVSLDELPELLAALSARRRH
jgi:hypothetical protein